MLVDVRHIQNSLKFRNGTTLKKFLGGPPPYRPHVPYNQYYIIKKIVEFFFFKRCVCINIRCRTISQEREMPCVGVDL